MEAECISPDVFAGKTLQEITDLNLWEGNKERTLGELFSVDWENAIKPEETSIQIFGDAHKVRRIGTGMTTGEIVIHRDAGLHLGEEMKGGKITVIGNTDSWTGSMMKGGVIEVKGNAGDYVGGPYRGNVKGMRGGTIIIHGNAGNELGCYMKKGLIKVNGSTSQFAGMHMSNGTILVRGNSEGRAGAEMTGGKIIVCGNIPAVLPTFSIDSIKSRVKANGDEVAGPFYIFVGDLTEEGEGKLYISQVRNPHLKFYEQYL